jgi:hypothetical protein
LFNFLFPVIQDFKWTLYKGKIAHKYRYFQVFSKGKNKAESDKKIADLDSQLSVLQKESVVCGKNLAGSARADTAISPLPVKQARVEEADMADLASLLQSNS